MLTLFTGLYDHLTSAQKAAINQLTVRRYVDDIYHLRAHLQQAEGLTLGTPEFEHAYAGHVERIQRALAHSDQRTYIAALLLSDQYDNWYALASMRLLHGQRSDVAVARSIGQADSSIPTHMLLQGFQYPQLPDFDPNVVTETGLSEVSRLVTVDQTQIEQVIRSGLMNQRDLQAVLTTAIDELIVNFYRTGNPAVRVAGWIFNVKPKLALMLKLKKGVNLLPLFAQGAEPTPLALSAMPDRLYFQRWHAELYRLIPNTIERDGTSAAVRYLAARDVREWVECEISLPYLLVNNAEHARSIDQLEAHLAQHRTYELARAVTHG